MENLNVGTIDRLLRVFIGLTLVYTALYATLTPLFVWLLAIGGLILIVTAISGICPVYKALRLSSCGKC